MSYVQPRIAYAQTLLPLSGVAISAAYTCTFVMTHGFEAYLPIRAIQATVVSVPPEVRVYRDSGGGFETDPLTATRLNFPIGVSTDKTINIRLDTGVYAIALVAGSHTATLGLFTQQIITAIESV